MKSHGIQNVLHLSVLQEILLVRAGDVERNPGPETEGAMPQEAFLCTASGCIGSSHPAIVQSDYQTLKCALNQSPVVTELESQHLYWFASTHGES